MSRSQPNIRMRTYDGTLPKTPDIAVERVSVIDDTAGWRAFNRLSAAVSTHLARSQPDHPAYRLPDENDDALHAAYTKLLRDIGPGGES